MSRGNGQATRARPAPKRKEDWACGPADTPPTIRLLLRLLDEGYSRNAWHGANLRGAIRGLDPRVAAWRPAPSRHNMRTVVAGLSPRDLEKIPRGSRVPNLAVLSGIAAHDAYHAGQIQLLKRLAGE